MTVSVQFLKSFYYIGSFQFKLSWDKGGTAEPAHNKTIKLLCTLSSLIEFLNILFIFATLMNNLNSYIQEEKLVVMTFHSAWCAVIWVCGVCEYTITFLRSNLIGLINESAKFLGRMQGESFKSKCFCIQNIPNVLFFTF